MKKLNSYILFLFIINILIRIFHHLIYAPPVYSHDTYDYLSITNCIINWDFSKYLATRPPVYPILLSLHHIDDRLIWICQSLMGVSVSMFIFVIAEILTNKKVALYIAILYSISFNILFAEASLLSETTSIFFLVLTIYVFTKFMNESKINQLIQMGLFSSLAVLTRPIMIILIPAILYSFYLLYKNNNLNKQFRAHISYIFYHQLLF